MDTPIKKYLKKDGKTIMWFWKRYIEMYTRVNYSSLIGQLNGRLPLNYVVESLIYNYIRDVDEQNAREKDKYLDERF